MDSQPSSQRALSIGIHGAVCHPASSDPGAAESSISLSPLSWLGKPSTSQVTPGSTPNAELTTTKSRLKGRARGRNPTGSKGPGHRFKWQPRNWHSILCPRAKAAEQLPPKGSSGHPWGQLFGGVCKILAAVEGPSTALHLGKQVHEKCPPSPGTGEGLAPSPECPRELGTSGCRACVGGRQRGRGRHRSCTPSSHQRLWTPNGRQGKLKSHHCFPPCPHPLSGRKQLVLILLPTQTAPLGWTGSQSSPTPSVGPCQCHGSPGAEPSLLKQVSVTRPRGMMKPVGLHPAPLCLLIQCPLLTFMACQAGHQASPVQLAAHPPRAEQQGRTCPFHHGSFHAGGTRVW